MSDMNPNNPYFSGSSQSPEEPPRKNRKYLVMTRRSMALLIVVMLLVACAVSFGTVQLTSWLNGGGTGTDTTTVSSSGSGYKLQNATNSKLSVQQINSKVKNSVVEITTESVKQGNTWLGEYVTQGAGSGVIIKSNGYIMTNNHVIDGASKITVKAGSKSYTASVVGTDAENDVAVIKINARNLTAVTYGNSNQSSVGDMAVVIGNPLGSLGGSVSAGIISAKNREVTLNNQTMNLIQTDASVNPGNSGGGMFNDSGQLIGLVVAKSTGEDVEGLGFAIPVNVAAKSASKIIKNKGNINSASSKPNTGMSYSDLTDQTAADSAGVTETGVYVARIYSSEATSAGFQTGDMIYKVNGKKISSFSQMKKIIQSHKVGDTLNVVILRNNQTQTLKLKLISESDPGSSTQQNDSGSSGGSGGSNGGGYDSGGNSGGSSGGSSLFDDFFNNW
jgi:serine protease Do